MNGRLFVRAGVREGRTVLLEALGTFPLRVLRPAGRTGAVVLLLAGGLLDGDDVAIEVVVEAGARLALRTQAATQVHAGRSRQTFSASVGEDAWLSYLPHAVVPHADADFHSRTVIEMDPRARVLLAEPLAAGRVSFGEAFAFRRVRLDLDVRCAGALVARERGLVQPAQLGYAAQFGAATHTASVYVLGPGGPPPALACTDAQVGCSELARGGWYVRAVANRAATLDEVLRRLHHSWQAG